MTLSDSPHTRPTATVYAGRRPWTPPEAAVPDHLYTLPAVVTRNIDGDSFRAHATLWPFPPTVSIDPEVRLAGCNAREHHQPGGPEAAANLAQLLPVGTVVTLTLRADDKFSGRVDCDVTLPDGRDLVTLLIAQQWVAPWTGTGPRPVPPWPRTVTP